MKHGLHRDTKLTENFSWIWLQLKILPKMFFNLQNFLIAVFLAVTWDGISLFLQGKEIEKLKTRIKKLEDKQ